MMLTATKRLSDMQQDLRALLPPDAILVGHSLDSDLKAMKVGRYGVCYVIVSAVCQATKNKCGV